MKKILVLFLLFLPFLLGAQNIRLWDNFCTSALVPNEDILINVDIDSFSVDSCETMLFYSTDDQQNWTNLDMQPLFLPGFMNTLSTSLGLPGSGMFHYGLQSNISAWLDTLFLNVYLSMTPENSSDLFPAPDNYMIELCQEETGDNTGGSFLDLTEFWGSYSDDTFYFTLNNNDTEWPLYETFPFLPPWYVYIVGLINPETEDSVGFVLVYADIPSFAGYPGLQTGLYKGDITDSSYTQIGNIQSQISNGKLYMACDIDDLTSDPQFGPWPNIYGCLGIDAVTVTININPLFEINDSTPPVLFYPTHEERTVGVNAPPTLSELLYSSDRDSLTFSIIYTDGDNNLPTIRKLLIDDSVEIPMIPLDHSYASGSVFECTIPSTQITSHAQAEFSDGEYIEQSNIAYITSVDPQVHTHSLMIYPNPVHSHTSINFSTREQLVEPRIVITNIKGQIVASHLLKQTESGEFSYEWNGMGKDGMPLASGLYLCNVYDKDKLITSKKLILMR